MLILDAELNGTNFLLVNSNNSNTEPVQLSTFFTLQKLLEKFDGYKHSTQQKWTMLILHAELNGANFLLINFNNSNTESEQLSTFSTLQKLLEKFDDYNKKILFLEVILA